MKEKRTILVVVSVLVVAASVRADMMRVPQMDTGCPQGLHSYGQTLVQRTDSSDLFDYWSSVMNPKLPTIEFVLGAQVVDGGWCDKAQSPCTLTDGQSGFSMCLSGLISLGAFASASRMKKMSFGPVPDWHHSGGRFQIGHCLAIGPDLCFAPVYSFVQPDYTAEDCLPQYCRGIVVSLVRKSQLMPMMLAARGPPLPS
jgi:hypothetical protein